MCSVTVKEIVDEFSLECISECGNVENIPIKTTELNRPGLQLSGYLGYFGAERIQVAGRAEVTYLSQLDPEERSQKLEGFFEKAFPCLVIARGLEVFPEVIEKSNKYHIPVLRTSERTTDFISGLTRYLDFKLAPKISVHGVFVEVYGEGILILGESGVGKSETALELIKRGHRLVADDLVEIRKVLNKTLMGSAPDTIRHFIEIRGLGILDIKALYGVGAVKVFESINLVLKLEPGDSSEECDRLGLEEHCTEILGISIPSLTVPVRPGRNLAIIVEVAAMNTRQKSMGYNAAKVLNERIAAKMKMENEEKQKVKNGWKD